MEQQYEQIEQYLAGTLTGTDLEAFEQALQTDPELAKEVALHQMAQNFLSDGAELDLRRNLDAISTNFFFKDQANKQGGWKGNSWLVLFGVVGLSVLIYFLIKSPANPGETSTPSIQDSTQLSPEQETSEPQQTIDTSITNPANTTTTNPEEPPIAARDPFAVNPILEALLATDQQSNIFEFTEMEASTNFINNQTNLIIEGELYTAISPDSMNLQIQVFNNDPVNYTSSPLLQSSITARPIEEEQVIAFAAKKAYSILYDVLIDLDPGLYYYQFTQIGNTTPLYTGKFEQARE